MHKSNKNSPLGTGKKIIIRKDIVLLLMICCIGIAVCFLLGYDLFYNPIITDFISKSHSHTPKRGAAIIFAIFGIPFFSIALLYHLVTYRFKYLEISEKGINDKMSIFNKEFIPFAKVKSFSVNFDPNHIVVKYGNQKKTFTELNFNRQQAKELNSMFFCLKHKDNPPKITDILYHEPRK